MMKAITNDLHLTCGTFRVEPKTRLQEGVNSRGRTSYMSQYLVSRFQSVGFRFGSSGVQNIPSASTS